MSTVVVFVVPSAGSAILVALRVVPCWNPSNAQGRQYLAQQLVQHGASLWGGQGQGVAMQQPAGGSVKNHVFNVETMALVHV